MSQQAREMPHDYVAEQSLLACLILDSNAIDDISDLKLSHEHFYDKRFGIIFESIADLSQENKPIDYVTLSSRLREKGKLDAIGGQSLLTEIGEAQASSANVYHYGKIVREKASIREIVRTSSRVAELGFTFKGKTEEYLQEVEREFFKITNEARGTKMQKIKNCIKSNLEELAEPGRKPGEISGLPTGYPKLDQMLLGMQPGQLIVLAARPAMGKTALALNIAQNCCEQTGLPVAIFSLEMLSNELSMRLLSQKAKVGSRRIKQKDFQPTDMRTLFDAANELSTYPIYINDDGSSSLPDIQSQCRKIKAEQGIGLILIDYLQLMRPHSNNPSREQQISEMSRGLKAMAKELACPVLALSQLNRGVESRTDKRPNTSDLRESGAIEQDADIVMFIYRDEYYHPNSKEPGVAEIIIGKNRSGEAGTVKLAWCGPYTSFENMAYDPDERHSPQ